MSNFSQSVSGIILYSGKSLEQKISWKFYGGSLFLVWREVNKQNWHDIRVKQRIFTKFQCKRVKSQTHKNMPQIQFKVHHLLRHNFLIHSYLQFSAITMKSLIIIWWLIINIYPMAIWEDSNFSSCIKFHTYEG
jgi:hypothetical protein